MGRAFYAKIMLFQCGETDMKAAVFYGPRDVRFEEINKPTLSDGEVLLKVKACGICGSDVKQVFLDGARDNPLTSFITFPHVMGHEVLGVVEETGPAVSDLQRAASSAAPALLSFGKLRGVF